MTLLEVKDLKKYFGGVKALDGLSFSIKEGEIVGLIGPNGSGKSTFFNVLMNMFKKNGGTIHFDEIDITRRPTHDISKLGISRTFQDSKPLPQITVRENLDLSFPYKNTISLFNIFFKRKQVLEEEKAHLKKIHTMLSEVGIKEKQEVLARNISYGQGKLLEILKVMASEGKLILLDEPFSGLFPEMIKLVTTLIRKLSKEGKTIILVEHNMKLISEICNRVIVFDAGKKIAEGDFNTVTSNPLVIESYLGK